MGKLRHILFICLMFIMTSCEILFEPDNIGNPVIFGAAPGSKGVVTRTTYSGTVDGITERIYWDIDDQVSIYMDWNNGNGYTGNLEYGLYNVYPGSYFHSNSKDYRYGRISHADGEILKWKGDFKDGRAHEYEHKFYSAYPPVNLINGKFNFYLPKDQNNISMNYAFMTAYEEGVKSNSSGIDGHIELHYYPMFTALFVTIDNEADFQIGNVLTLLSNNAIAGSYAVDPSKRYNGVDYRDSDITNIYSEFNTGETIMFFIIPREYNENELSFKLGNEVKPIPVALHAGYKYNINITTKEVEVFGRMTDAAAQLIAGVLGFGNGGQGLKDLMNQYLSECYSDPNYFNNTVWNNFLNNIRSKLPNVTTADFDMFSDDEWECIKKLLKSLTKLEVNNGNYLNTKLTKKDFELFPNIQEIELLYEQDVKIELDGWPNLKIVTIKGNGKVILTVKNCPELTTITFSDGNRSKGSYADVDKITCPKYNET